jgi:hypothetical protein
MRWTKWHMTSSRVAQIAVALALTVVANPQIESMLLGLKWT